MKKLRKTFKKRIKDYIYKIINRGIKIYTKIAHMFINKNKVLFISYTGEQYGDNPMYISEKLHQLRPKTKIVWLFNNPSDDIIKKTVPKYVKKVKMNRFNKIHHLATSLVWVDNDYLVYKKIIEKSKRQMFIETWHGDRGLKKCFYDVRNYKRKTKFSLCYQGYCDYLLAGSEFAENVSRTMFKYNGSILSCGYPRNDILFCEDNQLNEQIKEDLNLPKDAKILLYAPTFRGIKNNIEYENIDFNSVLRLLKNKYQQDWVLVYKAHHHKDFSKICIKNKATFVVPNNYDMAKLLYVSDMLITDYSSTLGDFILKRKPVVIYANDYEYYQTKDRGLHFDVKDGNFFFAENNQQLLAVLKNLTPKKIKANCENLLTMYQCFEDGTASEQVCNIIIDHLNKKGKKRT